MRDSGDSPRQAGQGLAATIVLVASIAAVAVLVLEHFGQAIRDRAAGIASAVQRQSATTASDVPSGNAGAAAARKVPVGQADSPPAR